MQGGKYTKLKAEELKTLYQMDETASFYKSQLLEKLLEIGDSEGLEWAKQSVREQSIGNYRTKYMQQAIDISNNMEIKSINHISM